MGIPTIKVQNVVYSKADKYARTAIKKCLMYKGSKWTRGDYGKRDQQVFKQYLIEGREGTGGTFLTGLLPRIKEHCKKHRIGFSIVGLNNLENVKAECKPHLEGITFRPDQMAALDATVGVPRGLIIHPTGSGKTIIALGIFSMHPNKRRLFLCHTKDLLNQAYDEIKKFNFDNVFIMGGGYKDKIEDVQGVDNSILLSTIQTFINLDVDDYITLFDLIIVDEVHHVTKKNSQYGKVMRGNLAPMRYGFTATKPTKTKASLMNEGYFGPVLAELTLQEGVEKGILAVPNVNLLSVPYSTKLNQKCKNTYKKFYEFGIVKNRRRNKLIVNEAIKMLKRDKITLVVIERTEHGETLQKMFKKRLGKNVPFVQGSSSRSRRLRVKKRLIKRRLKIAICSKVWREGINIPALDHVVLAVGMKEEIMVMQTIGRGLRTTEGKRELLFTDFLDPYRFLAEHTIKRLQLYKKEGWL